MCPLKKKIHVRKFTKDLLFTVPNAVVQLLTSRRMNEETGTQCYNKMLCITMAFPKLRQAGTSRNHVEVHFLK